MSNPVQMQTMDFSKVPSIFEGMFASLFKNIHLPKIEPFWLFLGIAFLLWFLSFYIWYNFLR